MTVYKCLCAVPLPDPVTPAPARPQRAAPLPAPLRLSGAGGAAPARGRLHHAPLLVWRAGAAVPVPSGAGRAPLAAPLLVGRAAVLCRRSDHAPVPRADGPTGHAPAGAARPPRVGAAGAGSLPVDCAAVVRQAGSALGRRAVRRAPERRQRGAVHDPATGGRRRVQVRRRRPAAGRSCLTLRRWCGWCEWPATTVGGSRESWGRI